MKFLLAVVFLLVLSGCTSTVQLEKHSTARFESFPVLFPISDGIWVLKEDLIFTISKDVSVKVPAGFVNDLASIPFPLNLIYDKHNRYAAAAILHDYLYWVQVCTRPEADRIYREALKASAFGFSSRNSMRRGLNVFGWMAYSKNRKKKKSGVVRFFPPEEFKNFHPGEKQKLKNYAKMFRSKDLNGKIFPPKLPIPDDQFCDVSNYNI